jgi:hypothetical protein
LLRSFLTTAAGQKHQKEPSKITDLKVGTWNVLSLYRSGELKNLMEVTQQYGDTFLECRNRTLEGS